ncbi:hypothetical protein [Agromyces ramosus]|uniref:MFS transporter n=1 Tax=Agromyces ramosus TaxID=33879 RepID=A0ABU0RBL1_9MICO|nr:hypothetical protein [Agromyces ramosus]MDQ0894414.1 hypothetical protein [Agromyces ramosus]
MTRLINRVRVWFTLARRRAIQGFVVAAAPVLVTLGIITGDQVQHVLVITAAALQGFAGLLSLLNLSPAAAGTWFTTVGRGVIYSLAAAVAPAAAALGFFDERVSTNLLTGLSLGLTALAALVSVLNPPPDDGGASLEIPLSDLEPKHRA